jgi:cytochrome c oxidase cbb3-type subunit III
MGLVGAERLRLLLPRRVAAPGDGDDVDEAEAADRIDMMGSHEPGAHETHSDSSHQQLSLCNALTGDNTRRARFIVRKGDFSMRTSTPVTRAAVVVFAAWMVALTAAHAAAQRGAGPAPGAGPAATPQAPRRGSPASQRPPATQTPQSYPPEQVAAGQKVFGAECAFCHGRDTAGGAGGPDLTRSVLVAEDVRGDRIAPIVRSGRAAQGMPAFSLSEGDLAAVVAFIHDQKAQAETANGDRRNVDAADLQSGNAAAGQRYFEASCSRCHAATGDFAGLAGRYPPLTLLQRMLYPRPLPPGRGGGAPARVPQTVTVTLPSGQVVDGRLAYRDEFTIALTDADGWYRSWPASAVKFSVNDPLQAHVDQLAKYTDGDMHDVLAYLQTLR